MANEDEQLFQHIEKLVQYLGYLDVLKSKCCSLSMIQNAVILTIGNEKNLSVNGLADQLRLDKSTVSKHVTNLVEAGYVLRNESKEDRRFFELSLTDKGADVYNLIKGVTTQYYKTIFNNMKNDDKEKLQQGLSALLSAIRDSNCC